MAWELEDVILECDIPKHGLRRGDIGTVVLIHRGGEGYEDRNKRGRESFLVGVSTASCLTVNKGNVPGVFSNGLK